MRKEKSAIDQLESEIYKGLDKLPVSTIDYDCLMEGSISIHISWDLDDPKFRKIYQDYYGEPFDDEE